MVTGVSLGHHGRNSRVIGPDIGLRTRRALVIHLRDDLPVAAPTHDIVVGIAAFVCNQGTCTIMRVLPTIILSQRLCEEM